MSSVLKICVLILVLAAVAGTPTHLRREKRQTFISRWYVNTKNFIGNTVTALKGGALEAYRYVAGTVREEAKTFLEKEKEAEDEGRNIVLSGRNLLVLATNIGDHIKDDIEEAAKQRIDDAVTKLKKSAIDSVNAGLEIIEKSKKIADTLRDSADEISDVLKDCMPPVAGALHNVSVSISEAGVALLLVNQRTQMTPDGIVQALVEVDRTIELVVDAGKKIRQVARHSLTLYERLGRMGKKVAAVLMDAANDIAKIAGITGKRR